MKSRSEYQLMIQNASSLSELCETLNTIESEYEDARNAFDVGDGPAPNTLEEDIDVSILPTFGGVMPDDTTGIYSWDETHCLYADGHVWSIGDRDDEAR